jgi:hypothetical protein
MILVGVGLVLAALVGVGVYVLSADTPAKIGLTVNTDPPAGGPCSIFVYRPATYWLDALHDPQAASVDFTFAATDAAQFDAVAPTEVSTQAKTYRAAIDGWQGDHTTVDSVEARAAATDIDLYYSQRCDTSKRVAPAAATPTTVATP